MYEFFFYWSTKIFSLIFSVLINNFFYKYKNYIQSYFQEVAYCLCRNKQRLLVVSINSLDMQHYMHVHVCMYFLTWKRISFDAECMRAWEKNERYLRNPHTSGTRKRCSEQVVQFFGTVKFEAKGLLQFLLAPSCTLIASTRFRIYAFSLSTSSKKHARPVVTEPENFRGSIPHAGSTCSLRQSSPHLLYSLLSAISLIPLRRALLRHISHSSWSTIRIFSLSFCRHYLPQYHWLRTVPLPLLFFNCFLSLFQLVPLSL